MFTHNLVLIIEMKSKIFLQYFKDTVYHCQLECNRRNYGLLIFPVENCCIVITGLLLPKPRIIISIPCLPTSYLTNSVPDESHSPTELGPKHASRFQKGFQKKIPYLTLRSSLSLPLARLLTRRAQSDNSSTKQSVLEVLMVYFSLSVHPQQPSETDPNGIHLYHTCGEAREWMVLLRRRSLLCTNRS